MLLNELLPGVRELAATDKLRLIRILAEEIEADVMPLDPNRRIAARAPIPRCAWRTRNRAPGTP